MLYSKIFLPLLLCLSFLAAPAYPISCKKLIKKGRSAKVQSLGVRRLNSHLNDPEYKVLVLGRHGKASSIDKFSTNEVRRSDKKAKRDKKRPLLERGKVNAEKLAKVLSNLAFQNVGIWGSDAKRVKKTAKPAIEMLGDEVMFKSFEKDLYYADVPTEMEARLTSGDGEEISHAFFWGHGETTYELIKHLTKSEGGFLPTAGVVVIAVKVDSWAQAFKGKVEDTEVFAWSPNDTHYVHGSRNGLLNFFELEDR